MTLSFFLSLEPNYGVAIFTLLASQLFGYGLAGVTRAFCPSMKSSSAEPGCADLLSHLPGVFPTWIVYPNLLPTVQLFDALHRQPDAAAQKKRLKLFWIVFAVIFCWEFLPEVRIASAHSA